MAVDLAMAEPATCTTLARGNEGTFTGTQMFDSDIATTLAVLRQIL